ncbi:hypothetical protein [Bartonella machadoae]|uniref:hypothetical protein n=1 Tax=Bartonella machadoae TaxID=2893471 RepID=UPI001F4C678F|nr:hypothetical protein [Bartonella machadoae]UNE53926.1 hypothetical protein LNM86_10130 [Bartonella machadoae]
MAVVRSMFLKAMAFCCGVSLFLAVLYVTAGSPVITWEMFFQTLVLCTVMGAVLGFALVGVNSRAVTWWMFLKALVFCCIAGVVLFFAYKGVKHSDVTWDVFLKVAGVIALLALFLIVLSRVRSEGASRCVWLLKFVVLYSIVGVVLSLARIGAMDMDVRWFLISNNAFFVCMIGIIPVFVYEGVRCVRVLWAWWLERGALTPRSR